MKKALIVSVLAVVPLLGIAGFAIAGGGQSALDDLRQATAAYHDIDAAREAGYTVELPQTAAYGGGTCIASSEGAMGMHMVSPTRIDGNLDAADPEALLYEKRNNGSFKLTGVEYIVAGGSQPQLYGEPFADTDLVRYGSPGVHVWTLHAWVWKPNPAGIFEPWNTRVTCD